MLTAWWQGKHLWISDLSTSKNAGEIINLYVEGELVIITTAEREYRFYNRPEVMLDGSIKYLGEPTPRHGLVR